MNFTLVQTLNDIPQLVDDLIRGCPDNYHPIHFIDILWDRVMPNPQSSGIIIHRKASIVDIDVPIETRSWFIDTLKLPDNFMSICGSRLATCNISLADVLVTMRFMCYDAKHLAAAFRACHHLSPFNDIQDFMPFAGLLVNLSRPNVPRLGEGYAFVDALRLMAGQGRPVNWNSHLLESAEAEIMRSFRAEIMKRPLSNDVVNLYVRGIRFLVDMYQWYFFVYEQNRISDADLQIAIDQSRINAIAGYQAAEARGSRGVALQGDRIRPRRI